MQKKTLSDIFVPWIFIDENCVLHQTELKLKITNKPTHSHVHTRISHKHTFRAEKSQTQSSWGINEKAVLIVLYCKLVL
jgi:uncharacterized ion transporter superfamily protein YfcC